MHAHGTVGQAAEKHPYYIVTSDYEASQIPVKQLHQLCHELNTRGFEAYLSGARLINGELWTPQLSLEQRAAHYKAGRKPVWVHLAIDKALRQQSHSTLAYTPDIHAGQGLVMPQGRVELGRADDTPTLKLPLSLPWVDSGVFFDQPEAPRHSALVYADKYLKAGGQLQDGHQELVNLGASTTEFASPQKRAAALRAARVIYCYEAGVLTTEALLCGCTVVYVQNDRTLALPPSTPWLSLGTAWGESPAELTKAHAELARYQKQHLEHFQQSASELDQFIEQTQKALSQRTFEEAWSSESVVQLGDLVIDAKDLAAHADLAKYTRLQRQFQTWSKRSTLREIDGEIYGEHVARGDLPALAVYVYVREGDLDGLAQTLDSLEQNLYQASQLHILANFACPINPAELGPQCVWHTLPAAQAPFAHTLPQWLLLIESGTVLAPQALVEFALAAKDPEARLVYADEAFIAAQGQETPHFKPDLNIEWLRSTNYLGSAVAVRTTDWRQLGLTPDFDRLYGLALNLSQNKRSIRHVDTVLFKSDGHVSPARELSELQQLQTYLNEHALRGRVQAQKTAGCRQIDYQSEKPKQVSVVIPTGYQLGYLRCLLSSLQLYAEPELHEIILVTQPEHEAAVHNAASSITLPVPLHIVSTPTGPYQHGLALNTGAAMATGDVLLFADDDTEAIQRPWLSSLTAYLDQSDVGCVAPRLVLQVGDKPTVQGGPMTLGIGDWAASYNGERRLIDEQGVFSRLQTSQDVSTVAGHFFLMGRALWQQLGGFNTDDCHTFTTVHDFCIRASQAGRRHVWTPISSVLHQGGKTVEALSREASRSYEIKTAALREKQSFLSRWVRHIAHDRGYNRHLSLQTPYDVEADLVVDWMSSRKDRPRAMAFPISSGSGQYRVVEPLNALQHAGLAQSCIVFPVTHSLYRTPTALEITRADPDRMIVQHSIGDAHLQLLRDYRKTNPNLFTIQTVDDLFHDLPQKHHLHNYHQREGYVRMREAMSLCDRVIVSTQPLVEVYGDYSRDVRVVPNCLDDRVWGQFYKTPTPRSRLRVGWAGAAQHLGDLEMIGEVVARFKDEVDWIFMGMCPDSLRPYIKEYHPFVSYVDYPAKLASLDLDIAIAPLEDNPFNRCKSNLRLLEYGAMGWPVVCSDVYPFRTENPPVLRVPNEKEAWIESVRRLIDDVDLRLEMGRQLNQWVSDHFYLSKNTSKWFSAIFD